MTWCGKCLSYLHSYQLVPWNNSVQVLHHLSNRKLTSPLLAKVIHISLFFYLMRHPQGTPSPAGATWRGSYARPPTSPCWSKRRPWCHVRMVLSSGTSRRITSSTVEARSWMMASLNQLKSLIFCYDKDYISAETDFSIPSLEFSLKLVGCNNRIRRAYFFLSLWKHLISTRFDYVLLKNKQKRVS